jgi:hypothetical protein
MFSLVLIISACSGLKDVSKFKQEDIVFSLKKGPCFGKCSVYNLDVYKNGYVVYEGLMNVEKYGLYARKISKQELASLKSVFDQGGFYSFNDNYPVQMSDLPTIVMKYNRDKESKTITGSIDRPKEIITLQSALEKLIKSDDFKLIKMYQPKTTQEETIEKPKIEEDPIIDNQIIIELNSNIFMAQWLRKYTEYDVQLMKQVSPDLNYWVITFNKLKVAPETLLNIIKEDSQVKFAEFNKRISSRDK